MKLLAFAASNSSQSINRQLVRYAASLVQGADVELLDLNDYEMPIFSSDREAEHGVPELAQQFYQKIGEADALLISFAEHNTSYSVAFKNIFDWMSRIDMRVYQDKPTVMLATSPGSRGAGTVLATATSFAELFGAKLVGSMSVPSFYDNFDLQAGRLSNPELGVELEAAIGPLSQRRT